MKIHVIKNSRDLDNNFRGLNSKFMSNDKDVYSKLITICFLQETSPLNPPSTARYE